MLTFLSRRLIASILVLFVASYIVYVLAATAGDPLAELRTSTARNKQALIEQRIQELQLNVPAPLRYFLWLGDALRGNLGTNLQGQSVNTQVANAAGVTIQLLTASLVLAVIIGILIGITSALRQYSGYDYTVTFLAFLAFSLPSFFIAVVLKAYVGIAFNNFLGAPDIPWYLLIIIPLVLGFLWMGIIGGAAKTRWLVFGIATVVSFAVLLYIHLTNWLNYPGLSIVGVGLLSLGAGVLVHLLTAGSGNKKSLYTAVTVAVIGMAVYYPFMLLSDRLNLWTLLLLGVIAIVVGAAVGYFFGGHDRTQSARTGAITAFLAGGFIVIDRYMRAWPVYTQSSYINGRPIGTVGAVTPNLSEATSSFWILSLDSLTHLLLPTISLMLISLAAYSRYSRANLLDVMNQDYIRTARAKGVNERTVVMRHAFRNALIPLTTIVAFDVGGLIGGAIITETVFAWKGMGNLFNTALQQVDVNPMMGFFLVTGAVAIVFNILADLAYSALDPRIRVTV
ncbi:MAG: ABC transporter permease [Microbacterium sp.]|uniref:ABC transporter permease n=1 Tax=Microbacterium sp. TaxID=51671 RepID=UPI001ACABCA0|nr:ABC transporter permease [Microbacterium sp.]MBN9153135.1 ABC transporter permease [Microbacterium sp.]